MNARQLTVIGIVGKARSGKDTIANLLSAQFGVQRIALADGVRSAFRDLDGPTWEYSKEIEHVRPVLQTMGTEAREDLIGQASVDHWISHALLKIRYASKYHAVPRLRFVIPDIRYAQEADKLRATIETWGGRFSLWKVHRPCEGLNGKYGEHKSETELDRIKPDKLIENDGAIEDLRRVIGDNVPLYWLFGETNASPDLVANLATNRQ